LVEAAAGVACAGWALVEVDLFVRDIVRGQGLALGREVSQSSRCRDAPTDAQTDAGRSMTWYHSGGVQKEEPMGHTFFLRIWIEETMDEGGHVIWRGHITHLPDERRRHVETFGQINQFIRQHLSEQDSAGSSLPSPGRRFRPVLPVREVEGDESNPEDT
jgi:hypothetical protein